MLERVISSENCVDLKKRQAAEQGGEHRFILRELHIIEPVIIWTSSLIYLIAPAVFCSSYLYKSATII